MVHLGPRAFGCSGPSSAGEAHHHDQDHDDDHAAAAAACHAGSGGLGRGEHHHAHVAGSSDGGGHAPEGLDGGEDPALLHLAGGAGGEGGGGGPPPLTMAAQGVGVTTGDKALTSRFRGVCWNKKNRRWQAAINSGGKYLYLGSYLGEDEAARAFDRAAITLRGNRAKLNFLYAGVWG